MPLIESIRCKEKYLQCWYADGWEAVPFSLMAKSYPPRLIQFGPAYGYIAEPTKSFLVVAKQYEEEAKCCIRPSLHRWGDWG